MAKETSSKWELLGALYKHGCNEEHLKSELGELDEKKIKKSLKSYRGRAKRKLQLSASEGKRDALDMWHDLILNCHQIENAGEGESKDEGSNYSFLIQKSLLSAACFEEHFQGTDPDEPNYNEIYRYLAQLMAGEEPTQLRPGNAQKILEMMSRLKQLLDNKESIQRYLNYINTQHSVSYLKPSVDVWALLEEKKNKKEEEPSEVSQLFTESDGTKLFDLDKNDPQYLIKREKVILKLSLKQRALASSLANIPGMNPLEMVLPSLVKPPNSLMIPKSAPKKRKIKVEDE